MNRPHSSRDPRGGRGLALLASLLRLDGNSRQLIRGGCTSMVFRFFGLGAAYMFSLLLARGAGAEAVGGFAIYFAVLSIALVIGKAGMDMTLLRFISDLAHRGQDRSVRSIYLKGLLVVTAVCLTLSLALFAGSGVIAATVFGKEAFARYLQLAAVTLLPATLVVVNAESLRALKKVGAYAFFQMAANWLIGGLLLVAIMFYFTDANTAIYAYMGGTIGACALSFAVWHRLGGRGLAKINKTEEATPPVIKMLQVSLPIMVSGVAFMVLTMTDTLMLGIFTTDAEVGVYNICLKMAGLAGFSLMAVNSIAAPRFAESYARRDMSGLQSTVHNATRIAFWAAAPVFVVLLAAPSHLLQVFGSEFSTGTVALLILTAGQIINVTTGAVAYVLQMTGRERGFLGISATAAAVNVILNLILIPRFGIEGAAIASTASMVLWNVSCVAYARRSLKILTVYLPFVRSARMSPATAAALIVDDPGPKTREAS